MIDENKLIMYLNDWMLQESYSNQLKNPADTISDCIKVVEEQHKIGEWIPCSKLLPEGENEKVIASAMWDGYEYTTESYFYHGKFYNKPYYQIPAGKIQESYTGDKVAAWKPFPEIYKEN